MALVKKDLEEVHSGGRNRSFRYQTVDTIAAVSAPGYFNEAFRELGGANGDKFAVIEVISSTGGTPAMNTRLVTQTVNPTTKTAEVLLLAAAS